MTLEGFEYDVREQRFWRDLEWEDLRLMGRHWGKFTGGRKPRMDLKGQSLDRGSQAVRS